MSKQLKKKSLYEETAPKCDLFLVFFIWGGGSINLKFVFSVSSLVYLEKYGLKKYEGQKKHSCTAPPAPYLSGTCKMRNEIETKRNETKRNKSKRNALKRNEIYRNKTKSVELSLTLYSTGSLYKELLTDNVLQI